MQTDTYRKCPNCGTMNKNTDHCANCGTMINTIKRREMEQKDRERKIRADRKEEKPNVVTTFFEKARRHQNPIVKGMATIVYSIWVVVFAIGAFFAYIVAYLAA